MNVENSRFTRSRFREFGVTRMCHMTGFLHQRPRVCAMLPLAGTTNVQRRKMAISEWRGRRNRDNHAVTGIIEAERPQIADAYPSIWLVENGAWHWRSSRINANECIQWEDGDLASIAKTKVRSVPRVAMLLWYRYGRDLWCVRMRSRISHHSDLVATVSKEASWANDCYGVSRVTSQAVDGTTRISFAVIYRILDMRRAADAEPTLREPTGGAAISISSNIRDVRLAIRFLFCVMPWMASGVLKAGFSRADGAHVSFNEA